MPDTKQPHIQCSRADGAMYAILPGDPQRVSRVKEFLDHPVDIAFNREYKSCRGSYKGLSVLVLSTGIGGPSAGIAVEELKNIGVEVLIRIGSCGALQDTLKLGDLVLASGAVRDDGASRSYVEERYPAIPDPHLLGALMQSARTLGYSHHCGIVHSHDSFYTDEEATSSDYWRRRGVLAADMETSALFVIGGLRKLKTASILNVVVEHGGALDNGINDYVTGESQSACGERNEIQLALETMVLFEQCKSV